MHPEGSGEVFLVTWMGPCALPCRDHFDQTGRRILDDVINAEASVGVHVPDVVPLDLVATRRDFFQTPGETRTLPHEHD